MVRRERLLAFRHMRSLARRRVGKEGRPLHITGAIARRRRGRRPRHRVRSGRATLLRPAHPTPPRHCVELIHITGRPRANHGPRVSCVTTAAQASGTLRDRYEIAEWTRVVNLQGAPGRVGEGRERAVDGWRLQRASQDARPTSWRSNPLDRRMARSRFAVTVVAYAPVAGQISRPVQRRRSPVRIRRCPATAMPRQRG